MPHFLYRHYPPWLGRAPRSSGHIFCSLVRKFYRIGIILPTAHYIYISFLARRTICTALNHGIRNGTLEISDSTGYHFFGNNTPDGKQRHGSIVVKDDTFWVRIFLWYDIGCKPTVI